MLAARAIAARPASARPAVRAPVTPQRSIAVKAGKPYHVEVRTHVQKPRVAASPHSALEQPGCWRLPDAEDVIFALYNYRIVDLSVSAWLVHRIHAGTTAGRSAATAAVGTPRTGSASKVIERRLDMIILRCLDHSARASQGSGSLGEHPPQADRATESAT